MAENADKPTGEESTPAARFSLADRMQQLRDWTAASRLRSIGIGAGLLAIVLATVGTWLYLATLTVANNVPTMQDILESYDAGDYDEARLRIAKLTDAGSLMPDEYGGPLFVLGAIKAAEAENQWSTLLRQSQFLIAAKYLQEAKAVGFPPGREEEGNYILGRSLIESGDNVAGLEVLEFALEESDDELVDLHLALAAAYRLADPPLYAKALAHIDTALDSSELPDDSRAPTLLDRIDVLAKLTRYNEARATLQAIPAGRLTDDQTMLANARINIDELRHFLATSVDPDQKPQKLYQAIENSVQRMTQVAPSADLAEEAMYLTGVAHGLLGDTNAAIDQFERIRKLFSSSPAGIAASVAEGDLYREKKRDDASALSAYRRSLTALDSPNAYRNEFLPLAELRQRMLTAHADFLSRDQYAAASTLVEQLDGLLGKTRQIELRAETLSDWGSHLIAEANASPTSPKSMRREGRQRLREAGVGYEELARRQFATPEYPDAVWRSAESYLKGQSFSSAIRMLDEYLRNEPMKRNAQALLRLGQAHLALGETDAGIFALEECIELHPHDAAVYRARLDCAKALRNRNKVREAEQLLLSNLNGGQTPDSAEWRESLFELGHLLYEAGRYEEAIDRLSEAVERDIGPAQTRLANYLIAESHRHAAEIPMAELEQAKTANEREVSGSKVTAYLTEALQAYERVRVDIANSEHVTPLDRAMLRNCYMFKGSVLFNLGRVERSPERFKAAIDEYSNVSTLYQNEPFVLETFVQIANCQRRLQEPVKARLNIDQALQLLAQLPEDADFLAATNFTRSEWKLMLTEMRDW